MAVYDDKSSTQVASVIPFEGTQRKSYYAIVQPHSSVLEGGPDFGAPKVFLSVIDFVNQLTNPSDQLHSIGMNGTRHSYVSVYDVLLHLSNNVKRATHLKTFLHEFSRE